MHRIVPLLAGIVILGLFAGSHPAFAQNYGPGTDYVSWSIDAANPEVAPGDTLWVTMEAEIAAPWKLYVLTSTLPDRMPRPFGVLIREGNLPEGITKTEDERQSPPKIGFDEGFGMDVGYFLEAATFAVGYHVGPDVASGESQVSGQVMFQICRDDVGVCLPPAPRPFQVTFQVDEAATASEAPLGKSDWRVALLGDNASSGPGSSALEQAAPSTTYTPIRSGGFAGFLLLAITAGLAALLTPCVFPMIPLTVSFFLKQGEERGQSAAVKMAVVYGLSIVLTFTLLGFLMAVLVGAAGAQAIAANPWVNLFIALVLVAFGVSLLGLFELRLPSSWLNYANRQSNERAGYLGVLFMGLTLTLVSFSCTVPFVGGLLAAAAGGAWFQPLLGMVAFSTTFALPFVLFALFPKALDRLPKSGTWMNAVKVVLGFVEIAAALKFFSNADLLWGWNVLSRPLAIAFTVVLFFFAGLYLIGQLRISYDVPDRIGVGRMMVAVVFFGTSLYMLPGLFGAPLNNLDAYLPPRQAGDVSLLGVGGPPSGGAALASLDEGWITDDLGAALAEAQQQRKPVFVDFTGYTCTNCRMMETTVFTVPEVRERFARDFVLLKLYTDDLDNGPSQSQYQIRLTGTTALPTYAIIDPQGTLITYKSGVLSESNFIDLLEQGAAQFNQAIAER